MPIPSKFTDFLLQLPDDERIITEILLEIIESSLPESSSKLSFKVPFYKGRKTICFVWPGHVKWGKKRGYDGVRFGFTSGHLLSDPHKILVQNGRKYVYCIDFLKPEDIQIEILSEYLKEAWEIDQAK